MDLTTEEGVVKLMSSSADCKEWRENANSVKAANNRGYPDFWYGAIVRSGLMEEVLGEGASKLKIMKITL